MSASLIFPTVLLLVLALASHFLVSAGMRTHDRMSELDVLREASRNLLLAMVDNETGQRGFVLTQKPEFLEPYDWSLKRVPSLFVALDSRMPDSATGQLLKKLHASVDERLEFAAKTVELQQAGRHDESAGMIASGRGKVLMDQVRQDEAALEKALTVLMNEGSLQYLDTVRSREWLSWGVIGIDVLLVLSMIYLLKHFRRSQRMLHVCAWSRLVDFEGQWITFEEYLLRRFGINVSHGISPMEAEKIEAEIKKNRAA